MDEKSECHTHQTDFTEKYDDTDLITKQDIRSIEGLTMQNSTLQSQDNGCGSNIFESKSDSVLRNGNDEGLESDQLIKDSINLTVNSEVDEFIAGASGVKSQKSHLLFDSESCLPHNDTSLDSHSNHTNDFQSDALTSSSDTFLVKDKHNESDENVRPYVATVCSNEEETLFNRSDEIKDPQSDLQCSADNKIINACQNDSPEHERNKNNFKEHVSNSASKIVQSYEEITDSRLSTNTNENSNEKNRDEMDLQKDNKSNVTLMLNTNARSNIIPRSTLADDSKLVKMSLLTNPMNIMQSNVHLLNKSRNFLNFITEKSTNIMEKTLLPQHLAMKYNHPSKSIESDSTRTLRDSNESSLRVVTCRSDTDLAINTSNALDVTSRAVKQDCDKSRNNSNNNKKLDCAINSGNKADPSIVTIEKLHGFENAVISSEKKCYILEKNDESDGISDGQAKYNSLLTESNANASNIPHVEKLHNDTVKSDSTNMCASEDPGTSKYGSLDHPLYLMLLEDYTSLKLKHSKLLERMEYMEKSNKSFRESQTNTDAFNLQIENLEKTVNKLTIDLNASFDMQEALKNECNMLNKEKENMVIKYVISEKQVIDSQRAKDSAERKVKDLLKDQELLQNKLRQIQADRVRICNILDGKCREITDHQKEIERLMEDAKMKEIKLKWTQNKLKSETDLQKETQQKLDKAVMEINNMREECEQIRRETQESFRKFQQSEENKAVTFGQQLKEHQARLILERHVTEDKETLRLQLQKELETLKARQQDLIEENQKLSVKVQECEKVRLNYENNVSDLKILANQRQERITELLNEVSHLETLKLQLQDKEKYTASVEAQIQQLRSANEELQSDMQACRQKEADMLDFTQKLTDNNVRLQSEFITIQKKANHLESEHGPLRDYINELNTKVKVLEGELKEEQKKRKEECELLAKHLAEQTQLAQNIARKLEDSQGENAVLKRKHQISVKEMARELQQCRKKLEKATSSSNSLDITSRTGSNTSLNAGDTLNGALSDNNTNGDHIQSVEPNKQVLMDHIIKLQEMNARRAVEVDFLKDHSEALVKEVQKKTKIIQNYILQQNFGAMGGNDRERNKAELAQHGGIMASLYNGRVSDENMTLDLSLEINKKSQELLEDVLLKNITLKENIDTLSKEIERLTVQYQHRKVEN